MYPIEHVPRGRMPLPEPTVVERYKAWHDKWIALNKPAGNSFFQFGPIFDPPEDHTGYTYRS